MQRILNEKSLNRNEIKVHIRWMVRRDLPEVLAIERECFEFAWNEEDFLKCLRQRNCIGMVAEHDGRVVGFMIYELPKNRIHLLNVATLSAYRRQGVGTQMIAKLIAKLGNQRRNRLVLEVRETNLHAQLFLRSLGFRATEILKGFYEEAQEDAYQMCYRHQDAPDFADFSAPLNRISHLSDPQSKSSRSYDPLF